MPDTQTQRQQNIELLSLSTVLAESRNIWISVGANINKKGTKLNWQKLHHSLNSKPLPNLAGCPAPPFKLVFWLQIHIFRQDCCKNFGHRFFQRVPQLNPMLNKSKSSWSRLLGQGSLKLHQQFCLAPIVGSYFHDLSFSSNACDGDDHLVFLTLYAWLILSFFLVYIEKS